MNAVTERRCVGIDVAKRHWDLAVDGGGGVMRFAADAAGLNRLLICLEQVRPTLVCLEATGGYERLLLEGLYQRGVPTCTVNPRQVRDFARALGQLAKTDAIDAAMIARFAATFDPEPNEPPHAAQERLRSLRARRQQVVQSLTQEKNRLGTADAEMRESIRRAIKVLRRRIARPGRAHRRIDAQRSGVSATDEPPGDRARRRRGDGRWVVSRLAGTGRVEPWPGGQARRPGPDQPATAARSAASG